MEYKQQLTVELTFLIHSGLHMKPRPGLAIQAGNSSQLQMTCFKNRTWWVLLARNSGLIYYHSDGVRLRRLQLFGWLPLIMLIMLNSAVAIHHLLWLFKSSKRLVAPKAATKCWMLVLCIA